MIIKALLTLVYGLLNVLLVFDLPNLPDTIKTLFQQFIGYLETGVSIIRTFIGDTAMGVCALLLTLIIGLNVAYALYSFVFWVIRKIPMLNVKE